MLTIDLEAAPVAPKDAATIILLRESDASPFEVFMVRRHDKSGFMAGAYVFPGGKLDDDDAADSVRARLRGLSPEQASAALGEEGLSPNRASALFVAALRETFEEAGVLLADWNAPKDAETGTRQETWNDARRALEGGTPFSVVLEDMDAYPRLDRIVPWSRWITPEVERRRYDTRFFLARAPLDHEPSRDHRETTAEAWLSPAAALAEHAAQKISLPPPTMRTLEQLSAFENVEAAFVHARSATPPLVEPRFHDANGQWVLILPGDPDHPVRDRTLPGPTRYLLAEARWVESA